MDAKLSQIAALARSAVSLIEEETPKTAEAATLLRKIATLALADEPRVTVSAPPAETLPPATPTTSWLTELRLAETPSRRPEAEDAFKTARATPLQRSLRRSPRLSPPKQEAAEPAPRTPQTPVEQQAAEPAPRTPVEQAEPRPSDVSDMSLDDEDVTSDELRRSERVRLRASSSSEASADAAMPAKETARPRADDKENDEPAAESPEERRRAAASFKARRRRRTVDARCLLEDDAPPQPPPRVALNAWSDDENVKGAEDETVELKANAEAETVEIGAAGTGAAAVVAALAAAGATALAAAAWAAAVDAAEAAQRVGAPAAATKRLAWADHNFSAAGGVASRSRAGVCAAVKALVEARDAFARAAPAAAASVRDALRAGRGAAAAFYATELDEALAGRPGVLGERAVSLANDLARFELRRLLNPPRNPISTPAALARVASVRPARVASPVSLVPECVAVAECALDRSLAVLVSSALDHCGTGALPPLTPPSSKGDGFAQACAAADAAVAPHARTIEACAARRFARRFLRDRAVTQAVDASGGWAGLRRAASLLPGSKYALLDDVPRLVASLDARGSADDAARRASTAALVRLQRADAAMLRRVCDVPAKQRVPKPKTLSAHIAEAASVALELDLSYPDFQARVGGAVRFVRSM